MKKWIEKSSTSENLIFENTFLPFNRKGDGKIETLQIGEVLHVLNLNPTDAEAEVGKYRPETGGKGGWVQRGEGGEHRAEIRSN